MGQNCQSARNQPDLARFGCGRPNPGQIWPNPGRLRPMLVQSWPNSTPLWSIAAQIKPNLAEGGAAIVFLLLWRAQSCRTVALAAAIRPGFDQNRLSWAEPWLMLANSGWNSEKFDPSWRISAQFWSTLAKLRPMLTKFDQRWLEFSQCRPKFGQHRPILGEVCQAKGNFGSSRPIWVEI